MGRSTSAHSSRAFETELRELRSHLLAMGIRCERILGMACQAFLRGSAAACQDIDALDARIDRDEVEIHALILRILALRQPVADDLRFLTTALRLITDLERVGDEAVNIGERVGELPGDGRDRLREELMSMTEQAQNMLRDALEAFIRWDDETAARVLTADNSIDAAFASIVVSMTSHMTAGTVSVPAGLQVIRAGKCLERIGDHATNVAEEVIFMVRGQDVRHGHWAEHAAAQTAPAREAPPSAPAGSGASSMRS